MPCRIRETRESSLSLKFKRCGCDWGFSCSHSKSRSSLSSSSSLLSRRRSSSTVAMCCSDGFPCGELVDLCDMHIGHPLAGPIQLGGHHYHGPNFHHHDHGHCHHGHHHHKHSSHKETYIFSSSSGGGGGGGGGERHTMNVVDMTSNALAHERGNFYSITFPLNWSAYDLLKRLTSNHHDFSVLVQGPFGYTFELKDDMNLKKYLRPCSTLEIVKQKHNPVKHLNF